MTPHESLLGHLRPRECAVIAWPTLLPPYHRPSHELMWIRFLKPKDDTCNELESIIPDVRYLPGR
jgi:hypothetical protein